MSCEPALQVGVCNRNRQGGFVAVYESLEAFDIAFLAFELDPNSDSLELLRVSNCSRHRGAQVVACTGTLLKNKVKRVEDIFFCSDILLKRAQDINERLEFRKKASGLLMVAVDAPDGVAK